MNILFAKTDKEFELAGTSAKACEALILKLVKMRRLAYFCAFLIIVMTLWAVLHGPVTPELESTDPLRPAVIMGFVWFGIIGAGAMQYDTEVKVLKALLSFLNRDQYDATDSNLTAHDTVG